MRALVASLVSLSVVAATLVAGWVLVAGEADVESRPTAQPLVLDCRTIIDADLLARLKWKDRDRSRRASSPLCTWVGTPGTIAVRATLPADPAGSIRRQCDSLQASQPGVERSLLWLQEPRIRGGCLVRERGGRGDFIALGQVGPRVVRAELGIAEERRPAKIRRILRDLMLAGATAPPG